MSGISAPLGESVLFSPRTANYVAALIRQGDKFDFAPVTIATLLSSMPISEPPFVCACTLAFGEGFSDMCLRSLRTDILAHTPRGDSTEPLIQFVINGWGGGG